MKHYYRHAFFVLLALFAFTGSPTFADVECGGCGSVIYDALVKTIQVLEPEYVKAKGVLLAKDQGNWTDQEIEDYLLYASLLIYHAINLQLRDDSGIEASPANSVADRGYLTEWPLNPWNEWQPIQLRDISELGEEYYPGDIYRETCPPPYNIDGKSLSFEVYVLGPSVDWCNAPVNKPSNEEWANPPAGTVHSFGTWTESDTVRAERAEAWRLYYEATEKAIDEAKEAAANGDED